MGFCHMVAALVDVVPARNFQTDIFICGPHGACRASRFASLVLLHSRVNKKLSHARCKINKCIQCAKTAATVSNPRSRRRCGETCICEISSKVAARGFRPLGSSSPTYMFEQHLLALLISLAIQELPDLAPRLPSEAAMGCDHTTCIQHALDDVCFRARAQGFCLSLVFRNKIKVRVSFPRVGLHGREPRILRDGRPGPGRLCLGFVGSHTGGTQRIFTCVPSANNFKVCKPNMLITLNSRSPSFIASL
jgi:hypothetical protein